MIGSALHGSRETGVSVRVSSRGPFAVGSTVWRDAWGRLTCTVVAKATFDLTPGESEPLDAPHPIQKEDAYWDDDPSRSVRVPSDLAPFKRAAEVVVVGSAFAATPKASVIARVVVGNVDKSVEAFPPRVFRLDGTLEPGKWRPRFSLRYEQAAGGLGTDNPAGIDVTRADGRGRRQVPQLLPPAHVLGPAGTHIPTWGLGPIAATWPSRVTLLGPEDRAWLLHPLVSPLPRAFPGDFFQAAASDQWLDRPLVANERIVLESLNPEIKRLVMSLAGREPRAVVAGSTVQAIRLTGDLLVIDTDHGTCTLTYRGQVALDEGARALRVIVIDKPVARELEPEEVRRIAEPDTADVETTYVEGLGAGEPPLGTTTSERAKDSRPVLPFGRQPQPTASDGVLPFRTADDGMASEVFFTPVPRPPVAPAMGPPVAPAVGPPSPDAAPARTPTPPPSVRVPPPAPVSLSPSLAAPAFTPMFTAEKPSITVPHLPPPSLSSSSLLSSPASSLDAAPPKTPEPPPPPRSSPSASSFDAVFGGAKATLDTGFGGLRASSDAAAAASARAASVETARERDPWGNAMAKGASGSAVASTRRQAVVNLLCFDAAIVPRVRTARRFVAVLAPKPRSRRGQAVDEPLDKESPDDRRDVLRLLSCGQSAEAAEIYGALADGLDDADDFEPPLLLVGGELRPTFDEVEMLRATVAIVQQVASGDKKILASVAVGQAALAAPVGMRPETTLGLVKQIEQAAASLSMPPGYVLAEVERVLVEGRKYKRRTLLGAPRLRADLTLRSGEVMLIYLPESAASSLPLLPSFPVVALCEVTPREDLTEAHDQALVASAVGRVLRSR